MKKAMKKKLKKTYWITASYDNNSDCLCIMHIGHNQHSEIVFLTEHLKHMDSLSLNDDFTRVKLPDGGLLFTRKARKLFITKYKL